MSDERVIAIDLGGTHIRVAVVSRAGDLDHKEQIATEADQGPQHVIDRMGDLVTRVAKDAGLANDVPIGVASPGPLDVRAGVVLFTPNLPGWRDVEITTLLSEATGRSVVIQNDGNCAALGEVQFGGAKGVKDLVYLALGTGVGGGVISNGMLVDGVRGLGAEVGHVTVAMDGPRCTCGSIGCLEAFVGGWAIARDAAIVATTDDGQTLARLAAGQPISARIVAEAAAAGDPAAQAILERAGRALGAAMGAFANVFNPRLFVIGGGVGALGATLLAPARAAMANHAFPRNRKMARIEHSRLGDDTALLGAAALAMDMPTVPVSLTPG
ncbi:MAG TPA: ROK family protein [Thermomicrobiales bacterium]|nr:ROK family protein [Thermomicrobiales bacterium]